MQKMLRKEDSRIFCNFVGLGSENVKVKSCTYAVNILWRYLFYPVLAHLKKSPIYFENFFGYLQQYHTVPQKSLSEALKMNLFRSLPKLDFKVSHIFSILASIFEDKSVIWSSFWCRWKELQPLRYNNTDYTYKTVQCLESFLMASEQEVLQKKTIVVVCKPVSSKEYLFFILKFFRKISF